MSRWNSADPSDAVTAFMATLEHPRKSEIEALRQVILAADPSIADGVKWNAPSYRTTEYFATTHLRAKQGVGIILHLGAKVKATAVIGITIADPTGMLTWLAKDRAQATFTDLADIAARASVFQTLLRDWIRNL
ncbi:MAG: DUF1801 domain-containing protein [Gemmatimonadaceae bacterium]|nr:DUF1801 domain-containing protein [Gemmatimonadaceae bacterium]